MHVQGGVASGVARPNADVDVSKQHLDVCLQTTARRLSNDAQGWSELIAMLKAAGVDLVVVEATGGYERGAVCAMQAEGVAVARVNPLTPSATPVSSHGRRRARLRGNVGAYAICS